MKIDIRGRLTTDPRKPVNFAVDVGAYPDGSPLVRFNPRRWYTVDRLMLRVNTPAELHDGLLFADALIERGYRPRELVLPYLPGQQQDRQIDGAGSDFLLTLRSVAAAINARRFDSVVLVDPHSSRATAYVERSKEFAPNFLVDHPSTYGAIVAPDEGAFRRAQIQASLSPTPLLLVLCRKTRNPQTGELTAPEIVTFPLPSPDRQRVLVVDDVCQGGGTYAQLAPVLLAAGFRPDLAVTHGVFTRGYETIRTLVDAGYGQILTTDTIDRVWGHPGLKVLPQTQALLEGSPT